MKGSFITFCGRLLLRLRYRVRIEGLDDILAKGNRGILLLPNHPAYVDPMILMSHFHPHFRPRSLADKDHMKRPLVRWMVDRLGIRSLPDPAVHGPSALPELAQALQDTVDGLNRGENCLLYPAGRIYHGRLEDLGGNSAVETILAQTRSRIVLVRTTGLWGSSFSRAAQSRPDWAQCLRRGLRALLANGLFFGPRRTVRIVMEEPGDFPRGAERGVINRYLEAFYNREAPAARYVPYTRWERGGERDLPEPAEARMPGDPSGVPDSIREALKEKLADLSGVSSFADGALLARDLGLDSLARLELQMWIEQTFGHGVPNPELLRTVGDCLLAAAGKATGPAMPPLEPPPAAWFRSRPPLQLPPGDTLTEVFLAQAARDPDRPAFADLQGGMRTYRDLLMGILALRPRIQALPGERVGIMLPASGAAVVAFFATLFAGKVPVMVNWTAGSRNLAHGLELLGVERVLTASQLVAKVESMGADLSAIRERFWMLEDLRASLTRGEKLRAFLLARLRGSCLRRVQVPSTAVVLFTSGSENLPKAVPLTHRNLLTNLGDLLRTYPLQSTDRMVGFLPPFHSFGLTGTLLLPLCLGLPVVYHPNPTDGAALARMVEAYRVTMLVGTPTFLSGIVRVASDAQLACLRMVVAGAEKCPESLYEILERRWPGMTVVEGYGITECSPVLCANRFEAPRRGTIGLPMPSVRHRLVDADSGLPAAPGQVGMLLVRGPSIFGGYLNFEGPSPFVELDGESWYRTGDLVREAPDGTLVFTGRLKRFVKLGGEMISLPAVEEVLLGHYATDADPEVALAVEAASGEEQPELVLFSVRPISREEANGVLGRAGFSPLHFVRQVRQVEHIPLLGTGKTDYRALKALLMEA